MINDKTPRITFDSLLNPIENINMDTSNTTITNNNNSTINNSNSNNKNIQYATNNKGVINNGTLNQISLPPPFIYPFGYENIKSLTDEDMQQILSNCNSPNGVVLAFDKIYSKMENKSFHKRNMNKPNITVVNRNLDIEVYKEDDFKKYLLKNIISLLRRILWQCKDRLESKQQYAILQNINVIEDTIENSSDDSEIIRNISNMIGTNNENKIIRKMFENFKKAIMDENYKIQSIYKVDEISNQIKQYQTELNTTNGHIRE